MSAPSTTLAKERLRKELLPLMRSEALSLRPTSATRLLERWYTLGVHPMWVVSFQSPPDEPDLDLLNQHLVQEGRLAWVDWRNDPPGFLKATDAHRSTDWRLTPSGVPLAPERVGLILVPGIAFTARGERLGRGSGAYDRLLAAHPNLETLGVGWRRLERQSLPIDPWDRAVSGTLLIG